MVQATSRPCLLPVGMGWLGFWAVSMLVIGQFCVSDREASSGSMVGLRCEFPVKPEGADVRSILIAHAMLDKRSVRNGHEILSGLAVGSPKGEGVFTDRSLGLKSNVL